MKRAVKSLEIRGKQLAVCRNFGNQRIKLRKSEMQRARVECRWRFECSTWEQIWLTVQMWIELRSLRTHHHNWTSDLNDETQDDEDAQDCKIENWLAKIQFTPGSYAINCIYSGAFKLSNFLGIDRVVCLIQIQTYIMHTNRINKRWNKLWKS